MSSYGRRYQAANGDLFRCVVEWENGRRSIIGPYATPAPARAAANVYARNGRVASTRAERLPASVEWEVLA